MLLPSGLCRSPGCEHGLGTGFLADEVAPNVCYPPASGWGWSNWTAKPVWTDAYGKKTQRTAPRSGQDVGEVSAQYIKLGVTGRSDSRVLLIYLGIVPVVFLAGRWRQAT